MSEQSKKKSLSEKLKNTKVNHAALIGTVLVLVLLAIIISVTVVSNRAKKKGDGMPEPDDRVETEETKEPEETKPPVSQQPSDSEQKPPKDNSSTVENKLPSFVLPVSGALSKKHDSEMQVHSTTMNDYRVHIGVDISTDANAPVYAAADGTVSKIWKDPMMGYSIAIKHSGNCYTIYKNLSETLPDGIREGSSVRSGQLIASVGESAMIEVAEEPHLHFEMTVADLAVDPLEYFSEKSLESLSIDASYGE
ncbi:MAG: M23 family metallopeptidase [Clostridia bacterium]|nr:M23 family metallopeptidase [Clostridia bacterium]